MLGLVEKKKVLLVCNITDQATIYYLSYLLWLTVMHLPFYNWNYKECMKCELSIIDMPACLV